MGKSVLRRMVSCVLLFLFPASMFAADSNAAMLYANGGAWVNGARLPRTTSAIFSGDLLETRANSGANINEAGSSITVLDSSLVQFEGASVDVQHGGVTVSTSKGIAATAGDVKVAPVANVWTEFNVVDTDGTVTIAARKGDLTVNYGKEVFTLAQGQETTRDENSPDVDNSKKKKNKSKNQQSGATAAAGGGLLNSPIAIGIGAGAAVGVGIWVLVKSSNPASPSTP